ncbi:hypothetical protein BC829DRAFT_422369 [Chytridium lagenaria]|nr:hypothetical protein BC829DRAFT_422369 [Chytridium lagenaria]
MATTISDICTRSRDLLRLPSQPDLCRQQPAITSSPACRTRCLSQECIQIAQFTHYIFLSQQCTCLTNIEVLNASPTSDIFCSSTCSGPPPCEPSVNGPFNIRPLQAEPASLSLPPSIPGPSTLGGPSTDVQQPIPAPTLSEPASQTPTSTSSPSTAPSSGLLLSTTNIAIIASSIGFAAILLIIGGLFIFKHRKQSSQKPSSPPSAAPLPQPPSPSDQQPSSRPSIPNRLESFAPIATEPFLLATTTPASPMDAVGRSMTYRGDAEQQQNDGGVLFASMPRRDGQSGQNGDLDRSSTVWEPVKPISSEEIMGLRGIDRNSTNVNYLRSSTLYRNSHEDGEHEPLAS